MRLHVGAHLLCQGIPPPHAGHPGGRCRKSFTAALAQGKAFSNRGCARSDFASISSAAAMLTVFCAIWPCNTRSASRLTFRPLYAFQPLDTRVPACAAGVRAVLLMV